MGESLIEGLGDIPGDIASHSFPPDPSGYNPRMDNSQLDIRNYDWFTLFRDTLDDADRKELDAFVVRVNEHQASIAVAGHPFLKLEIEIKSRPKIGATIG